MFLPGIRLGEPRQFPQQDLPPETYTDLRRQTVGVHISLAMGERIGGFEVPALAWSSSLLAQLRGITIDHTILVNEVVSLEKEEAAGEPNLILSLMRHHGLARTAAIDDMIGQADALAQRFFDLQNTIPQLCQALALTPPERSAVQRFVALMRALIRGNYDWSRAAGRYTPTAKPLTAGPT
ncbi:terpene synthase family protein [Streptomyces viridochromogenes]|uniref:terpene synthase family protein n=1 Tax=Streptomyces viridochromogenes TaxID=1938 RepID=UPI00065CA2C8|nr:hypothetical protein [Streptomyces viridochromogenes]